ncbi:MAG TPA: DUF1684 domain-containing protein [Bacteroidetes bacterium]|nr:DUF1684 domain-containing protein [Bacteroidota bacterium]
MSVNERKNSTFIFGGIAIIFALILGFNWFLADDAYTIEMTQLRKAREEMFRLDLDSPVPDSLRPEFKGLNYYKLKKKYRVDGWFEKNPQFQRYEMPRTMAKPETYIIAGWVRFKIDAVEYKLTVYNPNEEDSKSLFIPFRDKTSGNGTYGGGRYIDTRLSDDRVVLDFNKAYNPYCVYNYSYACPIPPEENRLSVAIEAGEKDFSWED